MGKPNAVSRRRNVSGWGYEDDQLSPREVERLARVISKCFPAADLHQEQPRPVDSVELPPTRIAVPEALASFCSTDTRTRCLHALGRSYSDVVCAFRGEFGSAPDVVATPRDAGEIFAVLDWCTQIGAACIPFGGGSSVVGGVTPPTGEQPIVTLQTREMNQVLEIDSLSRAARIQAGAVGTHIESQLQPSGFTLRYTPQSFEMSTIGGWIATHSAGHYATRMTHIDHLVEQITAVTPGGLWESRRLPASGAGPNPDQLLLGSEGTLGIITETWVRLQDRAVYRSSIAVEFTDFVAGAWAIRALVQSGLEPANLRLLDATEAQFYGFGDGANAMLLLGFESLYSPVEPQVEAALRLCREHGGKSSEGLVSPTGGSIEDGEDLWTWWQEVFLRAPYQRDALVSMGVIAETFETAVNWSGFEELHSAVIEATNKALKEVCGAGLVTSRISHVYPDGAAPYFTVVAPGRHGAEIGQWSEIKQAATEAIMAAGGTVTHHHAVGRDHRAWYDRQRSEPFSQVLNATKRTSDPNGLLNPGVLIDV